MVCEKCRGKMNSFINGFTQGVICPVCGWSIVTTYFAEIDVDATEYSLYIRNVSEVDIGKIKLVAKTARVNFLLAKQMLEEKEVCILKAKAPEIKETIAKLQELNIDFYVSPLFKY